jgi:hypothetical protein
MDEAQSPAQKAAFDQMLTDTHGNEGSIEEVDEATDEDEEETVEETTELDRILYLSGMEPIVERDDEEVEEDEVEEGIRIEPRTGVQSRGEQKKVATDFAKIQKAYPLGMQNMPAPNTRHHGIAKKSRQNRAKKGQTTPAVGYDPT